MAELDDLKKGVADVVTAINAAVTVIKTPGIPPAEVEAAAQALESAASILNAAVNPAPPTA